MKLPGWFRHFVSKLVVLHSKERGGVLFDYANGKWAQLHVWRDDKTKEEVLQIVEQWLNLERDEIYVAMVNAGEEGKIRGVFQVVYPKRQIWERYFSYHTYNVSDAYVDTVKKCREIATKLGYVPPRDSWYTEKGY